MVVEICKAVSSRPPQVVAKNHTDRDAPLAAACDPVGCPGIKQANGILESLRLLAIAEPAATNITVTASSRQTALRVCETLAKVIRVNPRRGMGLQWGTNPQEKYLTVLNHWLRHI